jgi:hypothetical protein
MDMEYYKYQKYIAKNLNLGGNPLLALKALSVLKKGAKIAKKASNTARLTALKNAKKFKKMIQATEMKEILGGDEQKELISILNNLITILSITSFEKIYDKKDEITELVNKLNEIVQESPIDDDKKEHIDDIIEFLNIISQDSN